jgi:hypothetical protein
MSLSSSELLLPQADKASARHEETAAVRHSRKKADGIEGALFCFGNVAGETGDEAKTRRASIQQGLRVCNLR